MIVILHNIRSLYNVGSIFRTADAGGIKKIYLTGYSPAPIDQLGNKRIQLVKVSLGAENYIPWEKVKSVIVLLKKLKKAGYKILALEQNEKAINYYKYINKQKKCVLVVGNEIHGLPYSILKLADKILEIPMLGQKESLNVAVAFGIVVFHLRYV